VGCIDAIKSSCLNRGMSDNATARFNHLAEVEHEPGERLDAIAGERVSVDVLHQSRRAACRDR
jgi:hypothetical protein